MGKLNKMLSNFKCGSFSCDLAYDGCNKTKVNNHVQNF